jgi:DNA mismatch repair ATPase MutL
MKKILIPLACLSALTLSACQNSSKPADQASSSKTTRTRQSSSKSKPASKKKRQAKDAKSAKKPSAAKPSSSASSSSAASSSSRVSSASSSSASASSSSSSNAPADYQALFAGETLTSFVNKYGESPAAYLVDHYGLSPKEALHATPDSLESFGEMQSESMYRKGQDPYAN